MALIYTVFGLILAAVIIGGLLLAYGAGVKAAGGREVKDMLRKAHLTKADAVLYRRAAKILKRLITVTDLNGDFAADVVSDTTRRQIEVWLTEYNKEIDKV